MTSTSLSLLSLAILLFSAASSASVDRNPSGRSDHVADCSEFRNDQQILSSWEFPTTINPVVNSSKKTYGWIDSAGNLIDLNIYKQTIVPPTVVCFKHLTKLRIWQTRFIDDRLPTDIDRLAPALTHLGIFGTFITFVPEQIGSLSHLTSLQMERTRFKALPDSIGNLYSLVYLRLEYGMLESIPATIVNIPRLETINLSHNPNLRSVQSLRGHSFLRTLQADHCTIEQIPLYLSMVSTVYLGHNKLKNLIDIDTLGYESDANKFLHFDNNQIRFISPEIQRVTNLYSLGVNYNELNTLPSDIYGITTLHYLMIEGNYIRPKEQQAILRQFKIANSSVIVKAGNQRISST